MRRSIRVCSVVLVLVAGCGSGGSQEPATSTTLLAATSVAVTTTLQPTTTTTAPATTTTRATTTITTEIVFEGAEVVIQWAMDAPGSETGFFTASGPAVDEGTLCPAGTTDHLGYWLAPNGREKWQYGFYCDDGGDFVIEVEAIGEALPQGKWRSWGTWIVVEGTDQFELLTGGGPMTGLCSGVGSPSSSDDYCEEEYSGRATRGG